MLTRFAEQDSAEESELTVSATPAADARLEELRRVTSSQSFSKAPRLCSFLAYIVERSVEGDVDSLSEQQIGIHVFKRAPGYNSNDDNIVRGTARALRQRLATYYLTEGTQDAVRIEIPKGAYVAQFHEGTLSSSAVVAVAPLETAVPRQETPGVEPVPTVGLSPSHRPLVFAWSVAAIFALCSLWPVARARWERSHTIAAPLWNTLFTRDRNTLIVPGDAGLNMYETLGKQSVDLNAYSQQSFSPAPHNNDNLASTLGARFYTTMSDLELVSRLTRLPQSLDTKRTQVRFARDLAASDLNDANLVLIGTQSYNPWTLLFQNGPTLRMFWDVGQDIFTVDNLAPQPDEPRVYRWTLKNGVQGGLTLISLTDNTQGNGRVLLIEGTTMGGVYAAADFLQERKLIDPILARARRPDGSLRNFDVLLQSDFVREGVSNLHLLAAHVRP
jgi:hypothetical protein